MYEPRTALDLELLPGIPIEQVIQTLSGQATEAGNGPGFSAGQTATALINHYVSCAEQAEQQLANVLTPHQARALIRTETYWVLRSASPDLIRLGPLLTDEYQSRQQVLERLAGELKAEQKRWSRNPAPLVVPDTNLFLDDAEPFATLDWASLADVSMDVRVVIPLIVVHELDRLKRQGNSTTAKLARHAIKWLAAALPVGTGRSERFATGVYGATYEVYIHGGSVRPVDADGVILDFCGQISTISRLSLLLVTKDLGMSLRADAAGLPVVYLEMGGQGSVARRG